MKAKLIQRVTFTSLLAIGVSILAIGGAVTDTAKLGVLVVDDITAKPIPNVKVTGIFKNDNGWLAFKGSADPDMDTARTDAKGRCRVSGRTNCGYASCIIAAEVTGYYWHDQGDGHCFRQKNALGIWQPDNLVVTVRLQRVEHPIPLLVKYVSAASRVSRSKDIFPKGEKVVRYDLVMGDWLPPVGKGKVADVEFTRHPRKTLYEMETSCYDGKIKVQAFRDSMTVKFLGEGNGLVELHPPPRLGLMIRAAPETGYSPEYECWAQLDFWKPEPRSFARSKETSSYNENRCFCFRIRTRRDERGKIVEAYYGKIYGDIFFSREVTNVCMLYYLNPKPLDRNLEWDQKTNLCSENDPSYEFEFRP
jgi:hypothetical protein